MSTVDLHHDDLIVEEGPAGGRYGIVLQTGPVAFDVLWIDGGSTTRFQHSWGRHIRTITEEELRREYGEQPGYDPVKIIRFEAAKVRRERRGGAGIRRGGGL